MRPGIRILRTRSGWTITENPGAFLGLGASLPGCALTVAASAGMAVLLTAAFRSGWTGLPLIGVVLACSGGASNLIDRVVRGSVVDFMNVGVGPLRTGIFNFADVAIMAGIALVLFGSIAETDRGER
jgi:signal peptidase II